MCRSRLLKIPDVILGLAPRGGVAALEAVGEDRSAEEGRNILCHMNERWHRTERIGERGAVAAYNRLGVGVQPVTSSLPLNIPGFPRATGEIQGHARTTGDIAEYVLRGVGQIGPLRYSSM